MISLLGIPWDGSSSFLEGAAEAPDAIRRAIASPSANLAIETGGEFLVGTNVQDMGNLSGLETVTRPEAMERIASGVGRMLDQGHPLLCLGGDHSVTWPILKATAPRHRKLTIVHLDAHPDLYPEFEGDPFSHACPFARIMERFDHVDLLQIGIRTLNETCRAQVERFGVRVIPTGAAWSPQDLRFDHPVYVSLDLDVMDPAFVPGISHHEPGGLSTREVISILHSIDAQIVGADLVELNPRRDIMDMTAMVAAKRTRELAGLMLRSSSTHPPQR